MTEREKLLSEAQAIRNAAASQAADLRSGSFPPRFDKSKLERNIAELELKAAELESHAQNL